MNWIRLSCDYFRHRKTLRLVRKLGDVAALYPLKLWLWAVEQSESGSLSDLDAEELAALVGYAGKPADLWKAMESCGFIENDPDDGWRIRSWGEHQLAMIEQAEAKREKDRARWRRWRARQLAGALAPTADEAANVGERGATLPSPARTNGTNGTERTNGGNGSAPPALLPDLPDLPAYLDALNRLHPKFANEFAVSNALAEVARLLPPIAEFEATLAAWAATEAWTESGGKFAPSAARWVKEGGFRGMPPKAKRAPAAARTVDQVRADDVKPALLSALKSKRLDREQHDALLDRAAAATTIPELEAILREVPHAAA